MLLPILEITAEGSVCLVKNLKFSYPLNDRALAEAVATEYHNLNPEQPVIDSILHKLIKQGFDAAKMSCRTHIEVTYLGFGEGYKATGFIDVAYHQASSNAIKNITSELNSILASGFSTMGKRKLSHGNLNQDPRSLLSNPHEWLRLNFWSLKEAYSTDYSRTTVTYALPSSSGTYPIFNVHNGVKETDNIFIILKDFPASLLTRELAKVFCQWYRQSDDNLKIDNESVKYADMYSKLPFAQVCSKNLLKSIRHYSFDEFKQPKVDRYSFDDFDYTDGETRVYGWYLDGNYISIRYMHKGVFRVDEVYLPDYYTEIFKDYNFNLTGFVNSVVLNKVSKRELRTWLGENKGPMEGVEIPYFRCLYSYLETMIDYERLNEHPIHCHDHRILRWLIHFDFINSDLKVLPRGITYCDEHYGTYTGFY